MVLGHGGREIDRHNPHLRDERRLKTCTNIPTTPVNKLQMAPPSPSQPPLPPTKPHSSKKYNHRKSKKKTKPSHDRIDFSPPGSSRYLLSDTISLGDVITKIEPLPSSSLTVQPAASLLSITSEDYSSFRQITSSSATTTISTPDHQVVTLKVSLHCKGCERKVRKHISEMKGVTSFSIDFAMKKVIVVGDVTPLGVLASISRVKHAKFWPSQSSASPLKSTC